MVPESDEKPRTEHQVYHHLCIYLCCRIRIPCQLHHRMLCNVAMMTTTHIRYYRILMENQPIQFESWQIGLAGATSECGKLI